MTQLVRTNLNLKIDMSDFVANPIFSEGDFTVTATRPAVSANPEPVIFEISQMPDVAALGLTQPANAGGYDVRYHRLVYQWDFGALEAGAFASPTNILSEHNEKRYANGARVFHVFETPGLKTVTLRVFDMTGSALATLQTEIRIYDADIVFTGDKTFYVDPDSVFPDKPSGCVEFNSFDAAVTALKTDGIARRILLAGGKSYDITETDINNTYPNFFVQCRDRVTAGHAVINSTPESNGAFAEDKIFLMDGIEITGTWTNVDHTGIEADGVSMNAAGFNVLMNAKLRGTRTLFGNAYTERATKSLLWDVDCRDWKAVGGLVAAYGPGSFVGVRGLRLAQPEDALQYTNYTPGSPPDDEQWGIRHWGAGQTLYYESCDFFVHTGNYNADRPIGQPAFRLSHIDEDTYIFVARSTIEGSVSTTVSPHTNHPYTAVCCNIIMDMVVALGTAQSGGGINPRSSGYTMRNCYVSYPNVKSLSSTGYPGNINGNSDINNEAPNVQNAPQEFYGNTYTSPVTTANQTRWNTNTDASDTAMSKFEHVRNIGDRNVLAENNIHHHPNLTRGDAQDQGPMSATSHSLTPRYPGILWEQRTFVGATINTRTPILDASFASSPITIEEPASGSPAFQSATTGPIPPHNLFGDMRAVSPNKGAI